MCIVSCDERSTARRRKKINRYYILYIGFILHGLARKLYWLKPAFIKVLSVLGIIYRIYFTWLGQEAILAKACVYQGSLCAWHYIIFINAFVLRNRGIYEGLVIVQCRTLD